MGHDIYGFNKSGEEIAYVRFSMWNDSAIILYRLLNANKCYSEFSGAGNSFTFSVEQMEKAMDSYNQLFENSHSKLIIDIWDQKQIHHFIQNCLETARKEKSVTVFFSQAVFVQIVVFSDFFKLNFGQCATDTCFPGELSSFGSQRLANWR